MAKKEKLNILTRQNHEDWFRRAKLKIRQKGAWLAVENTVEGYAWIKSPTDVTGDNADKSSGPSKNPGKGKEDESDNDSIEELTSLFARQGGSWNIEKKAEFDRWDAIALGIMIDGLDTEDAVLVDEYVTSAAVWNQLKIKYFRTDKSSANMNMTAIQNFKYFSGSTIDGSWSKLKEYRRKVIAANKSYAKTYPDDVLFHVLSSSLYKAKMYINILDGFMTRNLSVEEKLKILQEKESQADADKLERESDRERAFGARRKHRHSKDPRNRVNESESEMEDLQPECYCCGSKDHFVADCEYQAASQAYARKLRLKKEQESKRMSKSKNRSKIKRDLKGRGRKTKLGRTRKGHAAVEDESSSSDSKDTESTNSDSDNFIEDEVVALSKEEINMEL